MTPTTLRAYGEPESSVAYLMARPDLMATLVITFDAERVTCAAPSNARPINPPSGETGD